MLPRGEVALIVAGIALSRQLVGEIVFGVSIMMTLITTIVAPMLLVPAFSRGGSGLRKPQQAKSAGMPADPTAPGIALRLPPELCDLFVDRLLKAADGAGWKPSYENADEDVYLLRSNGDAAQIAVKNNVVRVDASDSRQGEFVALIARVRTQMMREIEGIAVERAVARRSADGRD
jgi:hypothetical protein